ncbi:hypothetical protein [Paraburkholderia rhizosphaerae]|uniref:Type III secretion protein D n=1 Tax=Paraburkholderia rhizosphaerae TaxID=480658 RepID=A0A4R8LKW6_9BURK|nr:hypothetical protein [Paraburkholderia rhizosphaerae]TDY45172.1 type III secretion protein D [Paraburkholderia rhizosphaerae]
MKILRILTGTHAGIQAHLTPGRYRIGKADDTDICITDWDDDEVAVELDEAGVIRAMRVASQDERAGDAQDSDEPVTLIPDFVPFLFGTTALCFGTEDAQWPPDIQLLASMYNGDTGARTADAGSDRPPSGASDKHVRRTHRVLRAVCASTMIVALLTAAGTFVYVRWQRADSPAPGTLGTTERVQQLSDALRDARLVDLRPQRHGDTIVVDGMVSNSAEDVAARAIFARTGANVARQYDVAQTDVANIEDSLGIDGLRVAYAGSGVFNISGTVPSLTQFREGLNRLQADLDSNVKRIDVDVSEAPTEIATTVYTAMLAVGDTRYVQTQDGVKHLFPAASHEPDATPRSMRESVTPPHARALDHPTDETLLQPVTGDQHVPKP